MRYWGHTWTQPEQSIKPQKNMIFNALLSSFNNETGNYSIWKSVVIFSHWECINRNLNSICKSKVPAEIVCGVHNYLVISGSWYPQPQCDLQWDKRKKVDVEISPKKSSDKWCNVVYSWDKKKNLNVIFSLQLPFFSSFLQGAQVWKWLDLMLVQFTWFNLKFLP